VVVRVDEAGHDDAAARVDDRRAAGMQARPDGENLLAFDQHVGLREIADLRVHRHDGAASNEVATTGATAVLRLSFVVRGGRARCQ
jgi:hypothetical protein